MNYRIHHTVHPPENWDGLLSTAPREAGIEQTLYWAAVRAQGFGDVPHFIRVELGGQTALLCLLLEQRLASVLHPRAFVCTHGPVVLVPAMAPQAMDALLTWIESNLLGWRNAVVQFTGLNPLSAFMCDCEVEGVFSRHGYDCDHWGTYLTDLSPADAELFTRMKRNARDKVRQAEKVGITVHEAATAEEFLTFINPVLGSAGVKAAIPPERVRLVYDEDRERRYHYLVARDTDGACLAVAGVYVYNGLAVRVSSGLSPLAKERRVPAQDLVTWHSLLVAKRNGALVFDMAGVNPEPVDAREAGIREFKAKWGGEYLEWARWTRHSCLTRALMRAARLRNLLRPKTVSKAK